MLPRLLAFVIACAVAAMCARSLAAGQTTATAQPPTLTNDPKLAEFWEPPCALAERDLYNGPWGAANAPDPGAIYTFVTSTTEGAAPLMVVRDPRGREWTIEQPPKGATADGRNAVVLSRVLSAIGFHQPPVYYLAAIKVARDGGTRTEPGGLFRLETGALLELGAWSWDDNPFAGTRPQHGLLVILQMFDSAHVQDANNTLYQVTAPDGSVRRWFAVRNLGRSDASHAEPVIDRITTADIRWASYMLSRLTPGQWRDAFRAGGYAPEVSDRYISRIEQKIQDGMATSATTLR